MDAYESAAVYVSVAQLDRADGYEPSGREFESLRGHQFRGPVRKD